MRHRIGGDRRYGRTGLARLLLWLRFRDKGAVTAEFATVLPAVMIIALLLMSLGRAVVVSMDCQDTAAVVARTLVVAGENEDVTAIARQAAGNDVSVALVQEERVIRVTVDCPVIPGPGRVLPTKVQGKAVAIRQ